MTVIRTPYTARLRFHNIEDETVQTLTRVRPNLSNANMTMLRQGINAIRATGDNVTGGFYTIIDELSQTA